MIRVSIEHPDRYQYRLKVLVNHRDLAIEEGVLVDFNMPNADLRILHHDLALEELRTSPNGRFRTPIIVDERTDSAGVINSAPVRDLMEHPDVKLWLKRNIFRDLQLNNEACLAGQLHVKMLNDLAKFHVAPSLGEKVVKPVTSEMAAKMRPLPIASIDSFAPLRDAPVDWDVQREIDVMLAGQVDYVPSRPDRWDEAFDEVQATTLTGFDALVGQHRREAIRQLIEIKHLRVLIGMNGAVGRDLYFPAMLRSSIGVSPWGLGEYAYRDYETILAGAVLVKPNSDHILTHAPDIYQSHKYYVPCSADFSDLHEVIRAIMSNRKRSIELARTAREALLRANAPRPTIQYFANLFYEALGTPKESQAAHMPSVHPPRRPVLSIAENANPVRGTLELRPVTTPVADAEQVWVYRDNTERHTHDIRLGSSSIVAPGLYRVRCIVRGLGKRQAALWAHCNWQDACTFTFDLETGEVFRMTTQGSGLEWAHKPRSLMGAGGWLAISAFLKVDRVLNDGFQIVLYAVQSRDSLYYAGTEEECFEIAVLDVDRVDDFSP